MAENSCIIMSINTPNTFVVNPEAHTSLQLLHRRSSDEDDGDDEDEGVEETADEQEEEEELEEEKDEENDDHTLAEELNNGHIDPSTTSPISSSLPSLPFTVGWGRGSQLTPTVIRFNFVS